MTSLKLMALDQEDLQVVSAHVQDAVFRIGDLAFLPRAGQFSLALNRFVWEAVDGKRKTFERRRAVLSFKRVKAVRSVGFDRKDATGVLSLLALAVRQDGEGPEGVLELVLSGGSMIALDIECIEVQLADTGGAWETGSMPSHPGD